MPDATPPFSHEYVETLMEILNRNGPACSGEAPDFLLMQLADLEAEALQAGACDRVLTLLGRARSAGGLACLRALRTSPRGH
ncbi:hypothetical protein [Methylobacterium oxalidis]|uniref:Uncharacterized protein n=1 Tax=Methylobacterium oxalidis TaxID=944322 RepID=A0A512JAS1_9HYPH|nr:hypothetical protein [Methylobacterium oxalidis]GEP07064.1 hypothetical protein MOX02_51020 [Methylobacterium oxalidis]GJE33902.1 hypothetical protein LDDCCGHA_4106 [Methylobacterium oxalidis]GLS66430.1 hypothetical protein GCM10007888_48130 [Methylobacterium oxalidis]